jgi:hypothetical protein
VEKAFVAAMDAWRKRRGIFRGIWWAAMHEGVGMIAGAALHEGHKALPGWGCLPNGVQPP